MQRSVKGALIVAAALALALPPQVLAQAAKSSHRKAPAAAKRAGAVPPVEAVRAADQLKLLLRFLYLYGRVSNGLELAEEQARKGQVGPAVVEKNKQNKASVVSNIANIRAGLDKLAEEFHASPKLQREYLRLLSATEAVGKAEQLAQASRFDEAGRALVALAERLADLLIAVSTETQTTRR